MYNTCRSVLFKYVKRVLGSVSAVNDDGERKFPCEFKLLPEKEYLLIPVVVFVVVVKSDLADSAYFFGTFYEFR